MIGRDPLARAALREHLALHNARRSERTNPLMENQLSHSSHSLHSVQSPNAILRNQPIVRHGESIGVLSMSRSDPGGFDKPTIALIETFADQLAVAMENARLLAESKAALEQQTATNQVLTVISRSDSAAILPTAGNRTMCATAGI